MRHGLGELCDLRLCPFVELVDELEDMGQRRGIRRWLVPITRERAIQRSDHARVLKLIDAHAEPTD